MEAYENARLNLYDLDKETLIEIATEWKVCDIANQYDRLRRAIDKAYEEGVVLDVDKSLDSLTGLAEDYVYDYDAWADGFYDMIKEQTAKDVEHLGTTEFLADWIWGRAEEYATCDNGGFNAWVCPSGCHTVPFDREEPEE